MTVLPAHTSFPAVLPALFEQIYSPETTYMDCVAPVVETLRLATGWDRAIYSEIRRHPQFSELVYVSEAPRVAGRLAMREIPMMDFSAVDFCEKIGGVAEVSCEGVVGLPPGVEVPESARLVERYIQGFLASAGLTRGVYAPRRLTPNFAAVLCLHQAEDDTPLTEEGREALKLAHIVLKEIVRRKRWRFRVPGHLPDHERLMPMLAAGWDMSRIAKTLERPLPEVVALRDHIMIELENQYGIRTPEAAIIFLRGELAKPV